jgi:hypothetical protein
MIEPTVLVHMNKSFNPFRSVHNAQSPASAPVRPAPEQRDSHNDSWHTNPPFISIPPHISNNFNLESSSTDTTPLSHSWFSGWTSSKSKSPKSMKRSVPTNVAIPEDGHVNGNSTSSSHTAVTLSQLPLSSQLAPAILTMNRGTTISPRHEENASQISLSSPQNGFGTLATVTGRCMTIPPHGARFPSSHSTISLQIQTSNDGNETEIEINLPPYPDLGDPHSHTTAPPPRADTKKVPSEDLASSPSTTVASTPRIEPSLRPSKKITVTPDPMAEIEEITFPGFALLQMATAQYCQGRYSQALDTTTECLAYQKSYFSHEGSISGGGTTPVSSKRMINSTIESASTSTVGKFLGTINGSNAVTPFDSRSSLAAQIGSSVLGVVRGLKSEIPIKEQQATRHQHPMLSNTVSAMILQYPTKPCVVKTLLLRGHVLVACGLHELYDDRSLIGQATKNVEMAVAIQRKLSIDRELATSLIFLGVLKSRMGQFYEADIAYSEATSILREVRIIAKANLSETSKGECSKESNLCKTLDDDITRVLYLHGKSLHCQRMYVQAFHNYNRAFKLCKRSRSSRKTANVKNIVRCMKKSCAMEKLVSAYWDDATVI